MIDNFRDSLHSDSENYDVWCERCQRVHRHFTFTKEDLDRVISEGGKKLQEAIDARIGDEVFAKVYGDLK